MKLHSKRRSLFVRLESNPPLFFIVGYLIVIAIGAGLLSLPIASQSGEVTSLFDCIFVSTSAVCVTGLTPLVTAEHWTLFGQVVIILLIQLGGLGIMTAFAAFGLLTNYRFSMGDRRIMMEEKGESGMTGMVKLIRYILFATFLLEGIGALLLSFDFIPSYGLKQGLWFSVFHSISAFCNAGFDLLGKVSLSDFSGNVLVILTISFLIISAGLGFTVYRDLFHHENNNRIKLHTKLVLSMTAFLLIIGTLGIYVLEHNNPATLAALDSEGEKLMNAFFQSVTTRTAGFFSIDQAALTTAGALASIFLMFIGGSPGGAAGGIKTTTMLAVLLGASSEIRGAEDTPVFHRNISKEVIHKSLMIFLIALFWCLAVIFILSVSEAGASLLDLTYEVVSGFATVGLSRNFTGLLSNFGKMMISATMLFGKIGPLTVMYAISPKEPKHKNRYGEERILVG